MGWKEVGRAWDGRREGGRGREGGRKGGREGGTCIHCLEVAMRQVVARRVARDGAVSPVMLERVSHRVRKSSARSRTY